MTNGERNVRGGRIPPLPGGCFDLQQSEGKQDHSAVTFLQDLSRAPLKSVRRNRVSIYWSSYARWGGSGGGGPLRLYEFPLESGTILLDQICSIKDVYNSNIMYQIKKLILTWWQLILIRYIHCDLSIIMIITTDYYYNTSPHNYKKILDINYISTVIMRWERYVIYKLN